MIVRSLLALALAGALAGPAAAQDTRPGIAVFPFSNGGSYGADREDLAALSVGMQQMLTTELAQNPALRVVERAQLNELLAEQELGASSRIDPQTAARLGKIVGARYVVLGNFTDLFGRMRLDGKVVDAETSEILNGEQVTDDREQLYEMVVELATRVTRGVRLPPLPAQTAAARRSRDIPAEAATLYSRALVYQDRGERDRAVELYRRIAERFPDMTEAQVALRQLTER